MLLVGEAGTKHLIPNKLKQAGHPPLFLPTGAVVMVRAGRSELNTARLTNREFRAVEYHFFFCPVRRVLVGVSFALLYSGKECPSKGLVLIIS